MTVLCVNLNPAIDKTLVVDNFQLSAIHRPQEVLSLPGGKGINVARALMTLGKPALITGWVGGHAGRYIEEKLQQEGLHAAFVYTASESRECLSILDPASNTITEIYERGAPVTSQEVEDFHTLYCQLLAQVQLVTLSGSLPPGTPLDFYNALIHAAHMRDIPVLLDTSGEMLRSGFKGRPALIKPNRVELEVLLEKDMHRASVDDLAHAANSLSQESGGIVVISLGSAGAVAAQNGSAWHAEPPQVGSISAVGSGDVSLAVWASAQLEGRPLEDALRLSVAAGTANTLVIGAGRFRPTDMQHIYPLVKVRSIG